MPLPPTLPVRSRQTRSPTNPSFASVAGSEADTFAQTTTFRQGGVLTAALNGNGMLWQTSPAVTELEQVAKRAGLLQLPPDAVRPL